MHAAVARAACERRTMRLCRRSHSRLSIRSVVSILAQLMQASIGFVDFVNCRVKRSVPSLKNST